MTSDVVVTERIGCALVATIDRESSGNAISREVAAGLAGSVRAAEAAEGISALIVTGRGGKFFAAGGDLEQLRDSAPFRPPTDLQRFEVEQSPIREMRRPDVLDGAEDLRRPTR